MCDCYPLLSPFGPTLLLSFPVQVKSFVSVSMVFSQPSFHWVKLLFRGELLLHLSGVRFLLWYPRVLPNPSTWVSRLFNSRISCSHFFMRLAYSSSSRSFYSRLSLQSLTLMERLSDFSSLSIQRDGDLSRILLLSSDFWLPSPSSRAWNSSGGLLRSTISLFFPCSGFFEAGGGVLSPPPPGFNRGVLGSYSVMTLISKSCFVSH